MTPGRAAELVTRWARYYTRRLPAPVAGRRVEEIRSDLHEHIAYERDRGTRDRLIALSIISRMARGLAADVRWRRHHRPGRDTMTKTLVASLAMIIVGVAAMRYGGQDDSPGLWLIGLLIVVAALGLVTRAVLRRRRSAGTGTL